MAIAVPLRRSSRSEEGARTAALYRAHGAELLRFAWHRLGRLEDAEDAVQATFLSAYRVLAEGEQIREPRAWLFRILRNECLTRIAMTKRRGPHEPLEEWHADPRASVAEASESRDEFDAAVALLGTLPTQQREALVLREWLGLSAIETASILESTPQGVDALVYRARKSLVGVADVADDSTCADVRDALVAGAATTKVRAHLLACRPCRTAARRLRAPEELAVQGMLPLDSIASRIGESIPGFAAGAAAAAVAGSGAAAATVASSIAAGTAVKIVAAVAIGAVVTGGALGGVPAVRNAIRPPANIASTPTSAPAAQPKVVAQTAAGSATVAPPAKHAANGVQKPVGNGVGTAVAGGVAVVDSTAPAVGTDVPAPAPVADNVDETLIGPSDGTQPLDDGQSATQPVVRQPDSRHHTDRQPEAQVPERQEPDVQVPVVKRHDGSQSDTQVPLVKRHRGSQSDAQDPVVKQPQWRQPDEQQPNQSEPSQNISPVPPGNSSPPVVPAVNAPSRHDGGDNRQSNSRDAQRD